MQYGQTPLTLWRPLSRRQRIAARECCAASPPYPMDDQLSGPRHGQISATQVLSHLHLASTARPVAFGRINPTGPPGEEPQARVWLVGPTCAGRVPALEWEFDPCSDRLEKSVLHIRLFESCSYPANRYQIDWLETCRRLQSSAVHHHLSHIDRSVATPLLWGGGGRGAGGRPTCRSEGMHREVGPCSDRLGEVDVVPR